MVYVPGATAVASDVMLLQQQPPCSLTTNLCWSQEQTCVGDAVVAFISAVAQHRCRSSTILHTEAPPDDESTRRVGGEEEEHNDGTETVDAGEDEVSSSTTGGIAVVADRTEEPPHLQLSADAPTCEWYQLVVASILALLQHEHKYQQVR